MKKWITVLALCAGCRLSGFAQKFFEVPTADRAQVKVFYVEDESVCDLKVVFVYEESQATKIGLWMEVNEESQANIKVIFVDEESQADLKVCLGTNPSEAGWLKEDKKSFVPF
ncbi:MAG: hypothetical protein HC896_06215 [Bacteroidales bacterium]|nr:hypothetical protein [Bacteroidales bacterium]